MRPVLRHAPEAMRFFDGYRRDDGRVGTRNYVAVVSTVNCSASVSQFVKQRFRDVQRDYPNVDGVIAITHKSGCGMEELGEDHQALERVLAGYARHPNVAAYVLIGLGCEVNQAAMMVERQGLRLPLAPDNRPPIVTIQESGGIRKTVERAVAEVARAAASSERGAPHPAARLRDHARHQLRRLGRQLRDHRQPRARLGGRRAGALRRHRRAGGDARDLRRRAPADAARDQQRASPSKLIDRYKWWEWYCRGIAKMDNNPAPGNKAGGLTTIFEKSLGGGRQGRHDAADGRLPLRRAASPRRGLRLHGHAGPRSRVDHGPGGGRLQRHLLHHRPRLGLRLQAGALDQARHQLAGLSPDGRGHGHQLRRRPRRRSAARPWAGRSSRRWSRSPRGRRRRASSPASARRSSRPGSSAR